MHIRSKKLLEGARDQACVNCGKRDGTVVSAHYTGMRGPTLGKGMGVKPHDLCIADLCAGCHQSFDSYSASYVNDPFMRSIDLSERFLYCIMLTLLRRVEQGILTPSDLKIDGSANIHPEVPEPQADLFGAGAEDGST